MGLSATLAPIVGILVTAVGALPPLPPEAPDAGALVLGDVESGIAALEVPSQAWLPLDAQVMVVSEVGYSNRGPQHNYDHETFAKTHNIQPGIYPRLASQDGHQYLTFVDKDAYVNVAGRMLGETAWDVTVTPFRLASGRTQLDYHGGPSIAIDGDGYLHLAFDHHGDPLRYARSSAPYSTASWVGGTPGGLPFDGVKEGVVTYVRFFHSAGHLFVTYRDGGSTNANLMLKQYSEGNQTWWTVKDSLLNGNFASSDARRQGAYWTLENDPADDSLHLMWAWNTLNGLNTWDLSYLRAPGDHEVWYNADGTAVPEPLLHTQRDQAVIVPGRVTTPQIGRAQMAFVEDAVYRLISFPEGNGWVVKLLKLQDGEATLSTVSGGFPGVQGGLASLVEADGVLYGIYQYSQGALMVGRSAAPYDSWEWRPIVIPYEDQAGYFTWEADDDRWREDRTLTLYAAAYLQSVYLDADGLQGDPSAWAATAGDESKRVGFLASQRILAIDIVDLPGQFATAPRPAV